MTLEEIDIVYSRLKNCANDLMNEFHMPHMAMDYAVSKLLSDIQSGHIGEITLMNNSHLPIIEEDESAEEDD